MTETSNPVRVTWSILAPAADIGFGVYVHVPFCRHKCDYCAFATFTDRDHLIERYLGALRTEIRRACNEGLPSARTIFVGGGTPTRVDPAALMDVLAEIPRDADAEFTVECNPDDLTPALLATYRAGGVNRVSIGVQSTREHVLVGLGRTHAPRNVLSAIEAVHESGLPTFNVDLIYGAVGETLDDWSQTVSTVAALDVPHVSAYALTVEAGTALATMPARHPNDDDLADKYERVDDLLAEHGLFSYEISNWARPGHECRHNAVYWSGGDYAGFGSAAHAHRHGRRAWNVRTPDRYVDLVEAGESAESSHEDLDDETRSLEQLQLALRTRDGVPLGALSDHDLAEFEGLVTVAGDRLVLTRAGRLLANEVSLRLRAL